VMNGGCGGMEAAVDGRRSTAVLLRYLVAMGGLVMK